MRHIIQFIVIACFVIPLDACAVQHGPGMKNQKYGDPRKHNRISVVHVDSQFIEVQSPRGVEQIPTSIIKEVSLQNDGSFDDLEIGRDVMVIGEEVSKGRVAAKTIIISEDTEKSRPKNRGPNRNTFPGSIVSTSPLIIKQSYYNASFEIVAHRNTKLFTERRGSISDLAQGDLIMILNNRIIRMPPRTGAAQMHGYNTGTHRNQKVQTRKRVSLPGVVDNTSSRYDPETVRASEPSPFGFFDPNMQRMMHLQTYDEFAQTMRELDVNWAAFGATFSFNWDLLQDTPGAQRYNWERVDSLMRLLQKNNIHMVGYLKASAPGGAGGKKVTPSYPANIEAYKSFVEAVVERYDGDGFRDMEGLKFPVKYWSVEDEPLAPIYFTGDGRDYARLLAAASEAIRKADGDAKVVVSMVRGKGWLERAGDPRQFMLDFFDELAAISDETPYDILDQHWLGSAPETEQRDQYAQYKEWLEDIERTAAAHGFKKVPFVNLELAGSIENDTAHAADLVKRHVYLLSLGVKKMLWSGIKAAPDQNLTKDQRDNYFRNVTLIDGDGTLKPAYWSYMFLVRALNGLDWDETEVIMENDNGVFVYRFTVEGNPVWVVWSDAGEQVIKLRVTDNQKQLYVQSSLPSATGGKMETYESVFPMSGQKVIDNTLSVVARSEPTFIFSQKR